MYITKSGCSDMGEQETSSFRSRVGEYHSPTPLPEQLPLFDLSPYNRQQRDGKV